MRDFPDGGILLRRRLERSHGGANVFEQPAPAGARIGNQRLCAFDAVAEDIYCGNAGFGLQQRQFTGNDGSRRIEDAQLVADRQFDVDAFDAIGVIAQPFQRDDHIFIDLEGIGMAGDCRRACAVQSEGLAGFRRHRDETLAAAGIGDTHHLGCGSGHGVLVFADDIADQHHFRPAGAA